MGNYLKLLDLSFRLFVIPFNVASIWLTLSNKQDNIIYGNLHFYNFTGLKYMVCVSGIAAGYALLAALSSWVKCFVAKAWVFFVSDQIIAYLMVTSMAAVTEITYLAYNGDREVTWSEACASYGKFCSRMKIALILHAISIFFFFLLAIFSAYRTFSIFDPPLSSPEAEEEEEEEERA